MLKRADRVVLALLAFWLGARTRTLGPERPGILEREQPAPAAKPASNPVLDHLEKTLSDNYRKEIDQEENVWRTIPFFVAALAFEVNIMLEGSTRSREASVPGDGMRDVVEAGLNEAASVSTAYGR